MKRKASQLASSSSPTSSISTSISSSSSWGNLSLHSNYNYAQTYPYQSVYGTGDGDSILSEFSVVTDFLQSLEAPSNGNQQNQGNSNSAISSPVTIHLNHPDTTVAQNAIQNRTSNLEENGINNQSNGNNGSINLNNNGNGANGAGGNEALLPSIDSSTVPAINSNSHGNSLTSSTITPTERFLLRAADPADGSAEDRLTEIINAKYEAGLLKPHNYANGYARFQRFMELNMTSANRKRILAVMGTFPPAFRKVAQSLTDLDLLLVEESFERLLYDYDRVFNSVGIPASLWRRTGEVCKINQEFASLVNIPFQKFCSPENPICIYELMSEDSIVNYWEKYGNVAFDSGQKAVLTSCILKTSKGKLIPCCFSFTIRRDKYNVPYCMVGNFLPM